MAISKKGLRSIVVNEDIFFWKFNKKVFVIPNEANNSLLIVDFGWYDVWDYANNAAQRPPDFEPRTVTPKFVSTSILYALNNGWKKGTFEIEFKKGNYRLKG
ncbi:hypothetical protein [Dokdonia sp.]|uniref:hypothetical protein n=1 Tax=Dokdonia sp. TaxID=2024995 RepID=UPI00326423B6